MNNESRNLRLIRLSVPVLLSVALCSGASLEHRIFKTYAPQQASKSQGSSVDCFGAVLEARSQPSQTTVEGNVPRSKTRNRNRGLVRKQRASESRHSSFTTQYEYAPVPSGL